LLLEIVYAGKIKRKRRTEPSDQAVEEKRQSLKLNQCYAKDLNSEKKFS